MRFNILGLRCAVKHHLPQAEHFFSMHTHVIVTGASWKPQATAEVCRCCAPPAQA